MTVDDLRITADAKSAECARYLKRDIDPSLSASERRDRLSKLWADATFARHVWEVARDYGLPAAMLFKASDGNIDPRHPTP